MGLSDSCKCTASSWAGDRGNDANNYLVMKRYGRVVTSNASDWFIGATRETNNTGEISAFIEAMLFVLFETTLACDFSITFVFDSLLSGSQTMGHWRVSDNSVNFELARNANALWKALNPEHAPIYGRWVRAHRGNRFNERVDKLAKKGFKVEGPRRRVFWKEITATVAAMGKANAAIRPHLIDLPIEELYKVITDAHQSVVEAVLPQLPKAQPRQRQRIGHRSRRPTRA